MKTQLTLLTLLLLSGCSENTVEVKEEIVATERSIPSNRVAIPPSVRSNLGITFARVERRHLNTTLRAPGKFEYLPSAKKAYQTMLDGQVELLVTQFESVEVGQPLFRLNTPQWSEIRQRLAEYQANVQQLNVKMEMFSPLFLAHEQHEFSVKSNVEMWEERIQSLNAIREAGGGSLRELTAARAALAEARAEYADLREKDVQLETTYAETLAALRAAKAARTFATESAAAMLGIDVPDHQNEWWKDQKQIVVKATHAGIVASTDITDGSWADAQTTVVTTVQPDRLRFHASGLQSDLGVLKDGLRVNIVPPTPTSAGNAVDLQNTMHGTLQVGLTGDANDRTIDLYVTPDSLSSWARSGVTAQLEIITDATNAPELAIPLAAVQQDGLAPIIFRRAPNNPNEAIRIEADLGLNDGRWVSVLSGLADGDEVVLDGGFQLMLATSGSIQQGGHFHSDGTFHEGDH